MYDKLCKDLSFLHIYLDIFMYVKVYINNIKLKDWRHDNL